MCILFALGHDEAALNALQAAASCPRYVEYDGYWVRVLAPRLLTTEARLSIMTSVAYPHLAHFRDSLLYVCSLAEKLARKGDHAHALALREQIASVGSKMRDSQGVLITALVGVFLQEIAWRRISGTASPEGGDAVQRIMIVASEFASYARQYGREDLAETTMREASRNQELKRKMMELAQRTDIIDVPWLTPYVKVVSMRAAGETLMLWASAMGTAVGSRVDGLPDRNRPLVRCGAGAVADMGQKPA